MNRPVLPLALARWRRRLFEAAGSARYSRLALDDLDRKLEAHLDSDGGFFVEAGANDGLEQSNTYYLERFRGWRGLLVEGMPELAARCRKNRPRAIVEEAALVAEAAPGATVEMRYAGLMSAVADAMGDATAAHVQRGLAVQQIARSYAARVPART
ncbi:MAG TPA: FkbM family methyltransferase, partial [Opitutus sp.]|nr:FkbM family methyltransferase [Opitutus sp.]